MEPLGFCLCLGSEFTYLRELAIAIHSPCTSSTVSERIWSQFDFIHSKRRDRLTSNKVDKLVFSYAKLKSFKNSMNLFHSNQDWLIYECNTKSHIDVYPLTDEIVFNYSSVNFLWPRLSAALQSWIQSYLAIYDLLFHRFRFSII